MGAHQKSPVAVKRRPWRVLRRRNGVVVDRITVTKEQYADFLASDAWDRMRKEVLERDGHLCRDCESAEELQVHHVVYVYDEDTDTFGGLMVTLCRQCHMKRHGVREPKGKYTLEGFEI